MKRGVERGMMREGGFACGRTFWWSIIISFAVIKRL